MSKAILSEVFFQANTIKGNRYLDDAGKIMNRWDSEFPKKDVGIQGLLMSNPDSPFRDLRVDTQQVWVHFCWPVKIKEAIELAGNTVVEIAGLLDVTKFSRLGLRVQYIYECSDMAKAVSKLASGTLNSKWWEEVTANSEKLSLLIQIPVGSTEMPVTLHISAVQRIPTGKSGPKLPDFALMIDADIHRPIVSHADDLKSFMKKAEQWIEQDLPRIAAGLKLGVDDD